MVDEGYILSNKFRVAISDEIIAGETNIDRIAKKHRIIKTIAYRVAEDLLDKGILKKEDNKCRCQAVLFDLFHFCFLITRENSPFFCEFPVPGGFTALLLIYIIETSAGNVFFYGKRPKT